MSLRRSAALLALVLSLALPLSEAAGSTGTAGRDRTDRPGAPLGLDTRSTKPLGGLGSERIAGSDGLLYDSAPVVVSGLNDELYLGLEFDFYCALGKEFDKGMRRLSRLARTIEKSGRKVVFTVAPGKSAVVTGGIDNNALPQGVCDTFGMESQTEALDSTDDPRYLPLRKALASDPRQVYWKTDPHWTTVGGSIYAQALANRLSPRIGRKQHYVAVQDTTVGQLNQLLENFTPETAQGANPANRVTVTTAPGSQAWDSMPYVIFDHSWNSKPRKKTWPGHTLLIGDSFSLYALQNLRPVFRHGRFLWTGHVDPSTMVDAIVDSNTVAIEVYQGGVFNSIIGTPAFRHTVGAALRADKH
jgi:acetyltransferase AlgX (SGNH hydrolase-like protein)